MVEDLASGRWVQRVHVECGCARSTWRAHVVVAHARGQPQNSLDQGSKVVLDVFSFSCPCVPAVCCAVCCADNEDTGQPQGEKEG